MNDDARYFCHLAKGHRGVHQYAPVDLIEWRGDSPSIFARPKHGAAA
ncbi:MAG: hypothetical protein ACTHKR_05795 [Sphingomonas sp.]